MQTLEEIIPLLTPQNQRLFACDCAERALLRERKAGQEPDQRSLDAVMVSRKYAMGLASDEELYSAMNSAYVAWIDTSSSSSYYAASSSIAAAAVSCDSAWAAADDAAAAASSGVISSYWSSHHKREKEKEKEWQLARAESYLEAQRTAKPSLLSVLLQRQQQLQQAIPLWVAEAEEALFL